MAKIYLFHWQSFTSRWRILSFNAGVQCLLWPLLASDFNFHVCTLRLEWEQLRHHLFSLFKLGRNFLPRPLNWCCDDYIGDLGLLLFAIPSDFRTNFSIDIFIDDIVPNAATTCEKKHWISVWDWVVCQETRTYCVVNRHRRNLQTRSEHRSPWALWTGVPI